ncbi:conserved protein [Tepidicaulis marinus]|uniref:Conserved protein n=1 Tax=Tepidicaulis marinus TaxID=1333998 RepID=A0A081BBF7_9HYPH|nr:DUF1150 family protein [Tepidicaulis marinus]GAK45375.1 conserved protein [Tepidicaulis marinus]
MFDLDKNGTAPDKQVWQTLPQEEFANIGMPSLVYVKPVKAAELAGDLGNDVQLDVEPDSTLYAVHAANGSRMAVLGSREAAFAGAVQYDFVPLSVH